MNIKKNFQLVANPEILRKIDRYLLLNRPFIWSSRVHYVIYYGLLTNLVLIALTLVLIKPNQIDELTHYVVLFLFISEIFVFFFWMFRQSIFNLEKDYGKQRHFLKQSILEIIIYLFCVSIIFSPSVLIPLSAMHNIASQVGINENTSCNENFENFASLITARDFYFSDQEDRRYSIASRCSDIQYFVTGVDSYTRYGNSEISEHLPYDIYLFLIAFFISAIGIPALIIQKYGGWKAVSLTSFFVFIAVTIITPIIVILNTLNIDFLEAMYPRDFYFDSGLGNLCLTLGIIAIFTIIQSFRILRKNNYSLMLVVNLGLLSVVINTVWLTILFAHDDSDHPSHWFLPFVVLLLIYSCLFPIHKKILLRNLSLPKLK